MRRPDLPCRHHGRQIFNASSGNGRCRGLSLIPRRAHPDVALFIGPQDHRHRFHMDRLDDGVRRRRQEPIDQVRAWDRLGLGASVALELVPMLAKATSGLSPLSEWGRPLPTAFDESAVPCELVPGALRAWREKADGQHPSW